MLHAIGVQQFVQARAGCTRFAVGDPVHGGRKFGQNKRFVNGFLV